MKNVEQSGGKSLEEILQQPDAVIAMNWLKLASLIMTAEKIPWKEAATIAKELSKTGEVLEYITAVRESVKAKPVKPQPVPKAPVKTQRDSYSPNYLRLMKIVPELEEYLATGKPVKGISYVTGYPDFHVELIAQNKRGFYLRLSDDYLKNESLIPVPTMLVRVDLENQTLEALSYQDERVQQEVYDNYLNPVSESPKEKEAQNHFLTEWLRKLIKQRHYVELNEGIEDAENHIRIRSIFEPKNGAAPGVNDATDSEEATMTADHSEANPYRQRLLLLNQQCKDNYQKLLQLIPQLETTPLEKLGGTLQHRQNISRQIQYEGITTIHKRVQVLAFHEPSQEADFLFVAVNPRTKKIWLMARYISAEGKALYDHANTRFVNRYFHNGQLGTLLNQLLKTEYSGHLPDMEAELQFQKFVHSKIPDFEPGQVKLLEIHTTILGIGQKTIDWVNTGQQGFTLTYIGKMNPNPLLDEAGRIVRPEFRLSKTGKIYLDKSRRTKLSA